MGESVARDQGFERDSQGREGQDVGGWYQAGMPCRSRSMSVVLGGITSIAPVRGSTHHPGTAAGRDKCVCGSIPCTATTHYRLCVFLQLLVVVVPVCFLQEVRQEALKGDMVQVQLSHITNTTCSIRSIWFLSTLHIHSTRWWPVCTSAHSATLFAKIPQGKISAGCQCYFSLSNREYQLSTSKTGDD